MASSSPFHNRWQQLKETIHRWRKPGADVLALGLSRKQCENLGFSYPAYNLELGEEVAAKTHRRVVMREKRYDRTDTPLREVLRAGSWWAVVGYNSKGLVEALLEGVPIFALGECVAQFASGSWYAPAPSLVYPSDRLEICTRLAYHQWTLAEIAAGDPWRKDSPLRKIGNIT